MCVCMWFLLLFLLPSNLSHYAADLSVFLRVSLSSSSVLFQVSQPFTLAV